MASKRYAFWFPAAPLPISPFAVGPFVIAVLLLLVNQSLPSFVIAACLAVVGAYYYFRPPEPVYVELAETHLIIHHLRTSRVAYDQIASAGPATYEWNAVFRIL